MFIIQILCSDTYELLYLTHFCQQPRDSSHPSLFRRRRGKNNATSHEGGFLLSRNSWIFWLAWILDWVSKPPRTPGTRGTTLSPSHHLNLVSFPSYGCVTLFPLLGVLSVARRATLSCQCRIFTFKTFFIVKSYKIDRFRQKCSIPDCLARLVSLPLRRTSASLPPSSAVRSSLCSVEHGGHIAQQL